MGIDELGEILFTFGAKVGCSPDKVFVGKDNIDWAKQAIYKDLMELIGPDANELAVPYKATGEFGENKIMGMPDRSAIAKNQLRQELREKVKKYCE